MIVIMEQGKDGARNPAGSPHFVLQLCFFLFLFFLLWRWRIFFQVGSKRKRGFTDASQPSMGIQCPGKSFGAVPVALVNETIAMSIAIRVETVTVAVAAPNILALKTGLLCPPYTNCVIVASWCEHVGIRRVPTYAVDCARVTSECLNEITSGSMPYVNLETWQVLHIITLHGTKENMQWTVWLDQPTAGVLDIAKAKSYDSQCNFKMYSLHFKSWVILTFLGSYV